MRVRIHHAAGLVAALVQVVGAQASRATVAVQGLAYDSLRRAPLTDAFITMAGSAASATTDSRGRFQFDSVSPGLHVFHMHHVMLDSLGFPGLASRVLVTDGTDDVRITVPSFATLWRTACGATVPPPQDSGVVYGTVRDARDHRPVAQALIRATWTDSISLLADMSENPQDFDTAEWSAFTRLARRSAFTRRRWRMEATSDANGGYTLCGVPTSGAGLLVQAVRDSNSSGRIDVPLRDLRVYRRDLRIGAVALGTIAGQLTDRTGTPFAFARVAVGELPETRSGPDGRFTIRDVPIGTRQVDVRFVGMMPVTVAVEVSAGDTALVHMRLERVTTLRGVTVVASGSMGRVLAREFDARRRQGTGYFADSNSIVRYPTLASALRGIPSVLVEQRNGLLSLSLPDGRGGRCRPDVSIDGAEADYNNLLDLETREVAGLELHARGISAALGTRAVSEPLCGVILVWTKYGFRSR